MNVPACRPLLFGLLIALGFPQAAVAGPDAGQVPGTDIAMLPPNGFQASTRFHGFEHSNYLATIMVVEIPGPVADIQNGMTRDGLASRGMILLSSETRPWNSEQALLLHVSQRAGGVDFRKWILVVGSEKSTTMIVGSYPVKKEELSTPIRKAMLGAARG